MLVLEHRNHMTNLLVRVGWQARVDDHPSAPSSRPPDAEVETRMADAAEELVDYLLFIDEAPLPAGIVSTSGFAEWFSAQGPFDEQGRSLHQLNLNDRLLRYPCSPLIYADAFDALPDRARNAIYRRLWTVLSGRATEPRYAGLPIEDRLAIVEILRATKPALPDYFQNAVE